MPVNTNAIQLKSATTVTLATDTLTPTQNLTIVASESGAADNCATINISGFTSLTDATNTFRPMVILMADAGDTITVKNGTGNITLNGGADYALSGEKQLLLIWNGTKWTDTGAGGAGGAGTVTSVGLSTNASYLTVAATPVTTSGTITINKTTALTANQVVATPDGVAGVADLRALVVADLPTITEAKGGTNQTTYAQGDILYASAANTLSKLTIGTNGYYLKSNGTTPSWATVTGGTYNYARCTAIKASGTGGDTFTASAWTTYPLPTEDTDSGNIVSIASNQFTLAGAGTYRITGVYGFRTTSGAAMVSRLRCRNITDSTTDFQSTQITQNSALASTAGGSAITIQGVVTIAGSKTFAIQYYTSQAGSTGTALTSGDSEVYASLMIEQIA